MSNETVRLLNKGIEKPVVFSVNCQLLWRPGIITGFLSEERSIDTVVNPAQPSSKRYVRPVLTRLSHFL